MLGEGAIACDSESSFIEWDAKWLELLEQSPNLNLQYGIYKLLSDIRCLILSTKATKHVLYSNYMRQMVLMLQCMPVAMFDGQPATFDDSKVTFFPWCNPFDLLWLTT